MAGAPTVLVVDDDPDALLAKAQVLERAGYDVAQGLDGRHALEIAKSVHPSLILLDVGLSDISGREVLRQIRADAELAGIPVVLFSSQAISPEQQAGGLDAGADGYIALPISAQELVARVRALLRHRELSEALRVSEVRYRDLVETSHDLIWAVDAEGRITFLNQACRTIYGYEPEEMIGRMFLDFVPPDQRAPDAAVFAQALESGKDTLGYTSRVNGRDGRQVTLSANARIVRDGEGRVLGVTGISRDISEALRAEDAARNQTALLRIAGRAARLGGWTIDLPDHTLTWSDETSAIHDLPPGYRPTLDEGIGFFLPEHQAEVRRRVEACERDGTNYDFELPKVTAKGRPIWVRSIGEAVRDHTGRIVRLQGAFQDISDRRRAEEVLRQSSARLAESNRALQMLSACNEAITRTSGEQELLTRVCSLAVEIGGYRMAWVGYASHDADRSIVPIAHAGQELGYLGEIDLSWSEHDDTGLGPAGKVIRGGQAVVVEDLTADSAGFRWQEEARTRGYRGVICLPLRDDQSTFGVLVLYSSEVKSTARDELTLLHGLADNLAFGIGNIRVQTERARMAETVREQASLLDKAQDAIVVRDLDHRILYWNRSAERLYGWSAAEVMGRGVDELLYRDTAPFQAALKETLDGGEWMGELLQFTRDDKTVAVESRWTLVRDDEGAPRSILTINTDITQRRHLEQQYLRAQRMESIGTLAGGIAHDLNNVLAPILMSIELLQTDELNRERLEILATIEASAKRGAAMVGQVLSFARGMEGRRVEVQLQHLVRDLGRIVRDTFPKNIRLEEKVAADIWGLEADPTQLHQVLLNLCVNARDAMPAGGCLTIAAANLMIGEQDAAMNIEAHAGRYVKIDVEDTGHGITKNVIDKIFDPFFTTKELGKGTGLGLATSLAIVKSHGGFIRVSSEPGTATRFSLHLPALSRVATPAIAGANATLPRGHDETVLVVDDEEAIRQLTSRTLRAFGYRVLLAANGSEAVTLYKQHGPGIAVVLTDMMMPVLDGVATVQVLRQMNPQVRIIGSSGLTADGKPPKEARASITRFLPKPFTADTLLKAVRAALDD